MKRRSALIAAAAALAVLPVLAQAPSPADMAAKLRAEETANSKLMWFMHEITDVYGPLPTGSPGLRAAQDFAVATLTNYGLSNVHLEAWNFGHEGWQNLELEANVMSPFQQPLNVRVVSWSPGTNGTVTAPVVMVIPPTPPPAAGRGGAGGGGGRRGGGANAAELAAMAQAGTSPAPMPEKVTEPGAPVTQADLDAYFASMKDKVHGAIVMVGEHVQVPENFAPAPLRRTDDSWAATGGGRGGRAAAPAAAPATPGTPVGPGRPGAIAPPATPAAPAATARGGRGAGAAPSDGGLTAAQINSQLARFLKDDGALVRIHDAGLAYSVIKQESTAGYNESTTSPNIPMLNMSNEDYGRIARTLEIDHLPVTMKVNIHNEFYPSGKTVYNVVAELPGTDKADEVVMLGGHFDSWNPATGATDNGAGSSVAVEAIRLLKALDAKPRRTIRVALWSGEEEGLLGSLAYVKQHFGSAEDPKPEYYKFDGYLNIDDGTGKPRAASVFGPPETAAQVQTVMDMFKDWGFYHVNATESRATGGTDSTSFNNAGLPGVGYQQDGFDYQSYTWHTNFDTYERIYEPDMREAAVEEAATVYALAMADKMLPRCSATTMPALPAGRGGGGGGGGGAAAGAAGAAPASCTASEPAGSAPRKAAAGAPRR